jgi:glycosyltransferase involved in cell wall biosynthesis
MRILHLDSGAEMRGGQRQVLRLIEGLAARGHDSILLARKRSPLFWEARRRGIEVYPLSLLSVARRCRAGDLTHAHDARSHTLAAIAAPQRLVVSRRVAFPVRRGLLSTWKYHRPASYIAVSGFVKRVLVESGIAPTRIAVVHDGVPMMPASHGSDILVFGSRDPHKGTERAIEAVRLTGYIPRISRDLEQDLSEAALFVYVTDSEGLGSAVLLAMAAGVPVIASNVGGLAEIVQHECTGLLTENSSEAIAGAVRRLTEDRALAQSLAARARCAVERKFCVDRMVSLTLAVYEALA